MKPVCNGFLLDKMELTLKEHGKIRCSPIVPEGDDDVLLLHVSGPYGSILFREIKYEEYSLYHHDYMFDQDANLSMAIDAPFLGLHFILKNNIYHTTTDGLQKKAFLKHHYNMAYVPSVQCEFIFRKAEEYTTFSIYFSIAYLERWQDPFPFLTEFLNKVRCKIPAVLGRTNPAVTPEMMSIIQSILHCTYTGKLKKMYLQAKILELLMLSLQQITPYDYSSQKVLRQTDITKIQNAREYIVEHMDSPCTLTALAHQVGINVFKLKHGFKQLYGTTVFGHLLEERMQRARVLLMHTDMFINEIALSTGYKNLSNFTAAFKKRFGYPPSAIKQSIS